MPHLQELCRVRIGWLRAGQVCLKSKLGLDEYSARNVAVRFGGSTNPLWTPLSKEQSLNAMLASSPRFLLEGGCSTDNPLVKVHVAAKFYEFELAGVLDGWLGQEMVERGAESLFSPFLTELDNVAAHLARHGQVVQSGCWGSSVCFHTLWLIHTPKGGLDFAGYVDLTRVPLGLFAEKPPASSHPCKIAFSPLKK
jgi:hypothetical protein